MRRTPTRRSQRPGRGIGPKRSGRSSWPCRDAPRDGWEERRAYHYETSPNERATVFAQAWRAGTQWVVLIVDASDPTFEKRGSHFSLAINSLRPRGYARETFAGRKAHPLDAKRAAVMKDFVARGMELLGVPGVGFSLIDGGAVVFEGGLGVRELGKPDPVDADTRFIAASNTKAMTTLLLAVLVDEGKLRWDQPVSEVYPDFKLGDAATTKQVLVKHLVCACTGLPRQDLEWLFEYQQRHVGLELEASGHDAADEPLRRGLPVQQPHGGGGRLRRGGGRLPRPRAGRRLRRCDADEDLRAARHDAHDLRLRAVLAGQRRAAALRRRRPEAHGRAHGPQRVGDTGPACRRRLDQRARPVPVRPDGAGAGDAPRRQAADLRGKPARPPRPAGRRERGHHLRDGARGRPPLGRPDRPPRRRPRGLPQRHDVVSRARRGCGAPDQLGLGRTSSADRSCASSRR